LGKPNARAVSSNNRRGIRRYSQVPRTAKSPSVAYGAAGLDNGISVPLHGARDRIAVVSFASSATDSEHEAKIDRLNALASQCHVAFTHVSEGTRSSEIPVQLSRRERDCLIWIAQGKSSWDIGMILNISGNTVNYHVKNAMRKLGTTSRTVAVVKAIRLNLIECP